MASTFSGIVLKRIKGAKGAFGAAPAFVKVPQPLPPEDGGDDAGLYAPGSPGAGDAYADDGIDPELDDGFWGGDGHPIEDVLGIDPHEDMISAADATSDSGGQPGPEAPATIAAQVAPAELPSTTPAQAEKLFQEAIVARNAWAQRASEASAAANAAAACSDVDAFQAAAADAKEAQAQAAAAEAFAKQMAVQVKAQVFTESATSTAPQVPQSQVMPSMPAAGVSLPKLAVGAGIGYFVAGTKGAVIGAVVAWWLGNNAASVASTLAKAAGGGVEASP